MTRILITGVAGFIGSNLAHSLVQKGHRIVGIDNLAYGVREQVPDDVEFHQVDVRSADIYPLFNNIDFVFHLAAKNCINDCQINPVETSDINVTGTANVFEAAKRGGVKKIIYAESSAVYEGSSKFPTPEHEVRPLSFYAMSKNSARLFAEAYSRYSGIKITGLRYFCVYGPRQDYRRTIPPLFSAFIIRLLRGQQPIIYGSGEKQRDFIHVDDVNRFHIQCLEDHRTDGEVFNLGSGVSYSVNHIYELIAQILDADIPPTHQPDLPGEAEITLADISKAKALEWYPRVDLARGMGTAVEFIRNEMNKGRI